MLAAILESYPPGPFLFCVCDKRRILALAEFIGLWPNLLFTSEFFQDMCIASRQPVFECLQKEAFHYMHLTIHFVYQLEVRERRIIFF